MGAHTQADEASLSGRRARQFDAVSRFESWTATELSGRTAASAAEIPELRRLLSTWFSRIVVDMDAEAVEISAMRRVTGEVPDSDSFTETSVRFGRAEWTRVACHVRRKRIRSRAWDDAEILGAMQAWAETNGRSPTWTDWQQGQGKWPTTRTVVRLKTWNHAVRAAGLMPYLPTVPPRNHPWTDQQVVQALQRWAAKYRRPPKSFEWYRSELGRPCIQTVEKHFGSWRAALAAAGLA